jgi:hypothetical protein
MLEKSFDERNIKDRAFLGIEMLKIPIFIVEYTVVVRHK